MSTRTAAPPIERFADGLFLPECPRWHAGAFGLCDMWGHAILRFDEAGARRVVHRFPDDEDPGGLGWLPSGELVVVGMEGRRVYRLEDGSAALPRVHADLSPLAAWPCNDMIVRRDGTAFVSHFGYDMWGGTTGFRAATLIRVGPDGRSAVAAEDLLAPNGMALPEDERTLFLSECGRSQLLAFDVAPDGALSNRRVHAALPLAPGQAFAPPDGICLDAEGAVWAAEPIGKRVLRIDRAGRVTDEIGFEIAPLAVVLGGADRRTLFVCASGEHDKPNRGRVPTGRVDALRVAVPGAGRP
jgi:sugar lactone lactonase YvrE